MVNNCRQNLKGTDDGKASHSNLTLTFSFTVDFYELYVVHNDISDKDSPVQDIKAMVRYFPESTQKHSQCSATH